jgi:hypothetical protein
MSDPTPTANGQAYRAYLEVALAVLDRLTAIDYYPSPLPSPADEALAEIVSAFTAWPPSVRERFLAALPSDKRGLFGIFGHRAATLAVRQSDPDRLRLGLVGSAVANYDPPPDRNVEVALAVFYHCARKLEMDPAELFDEAAEFTSDETATRMRAFGRRAGLTLKQFGWREIKTPDGVRYKFEW